MKKYKTQSGSIYEVTSDGKILKNARPLKVLKNYKPIDDFEFVGATPVREIPKQETLRTEVAVYLLWIKEKPERREHLFFLPKSSRMYWRRENPFRIVINKDHYDDLLGKIKRGEIKVTSGTIEEVIEDEQISEEDWWSAKTA